MSFFDTVRDKITGALAGFQAGGDMLSSVAEALDDAATYDAGMRTKEAVGSGLAELELMEEDINWREMASGEGRFDFTRTSLRRMVTRSRVMYLINPLIHRAVVLQELYVWGGGVTIEAEDEDVDGVVSQFFDDRRNQRVIGEGWGEREREQRIDGNTFLIFFVNRRNGEARVRSLPFHQVADIILNPEDATEPWFYLRQEYTGSVVMIDGTVSNPDINRTVQPKILYPDIDYNPVVKLPSYNGITIKWDCPVMHIRSGAMSTMKFGIPELYSALNWATGYKKILENFATVLAAYARMAMKMTGLPGKRGVAAAKSKMGTTVGTGNTRDTNPPNTTAGWFMASGSVDVAPIKTAGSTTGPDEARALRCMVAAGSDTPEHFFGDSDVGNFATSSTLDRPTELKMVGRQRMWMLVILRISMKLIEWSARAPLGKLRKAKFTVDITQDSFDSRQQSVMITAPDNRSLKIYVEFPSILERDVTDRVRAVVQAATLGGSPAEGIIPDRALLFELLMVALGEKDAKALVDKYYPKPVMQGFKDPADMLADDHLAALGKKELGDAALQQAAAAQKAAGKANGKPSSSGSPAPAISSR
jgi:hypothetical protein